jgi:pimeloyl-ACP methyl ester carboxylesterase
VPFANNEGIKIYYEVEGQGTPLVMAHGLGGSLDDWRDLGWTERLRDRYQLILVDGRGHGRSDKPHDQEAYRQRHVAADHVAVLDDAGLYQAHFLGWSMGGIVCLGAGIGVPERCLSLVIGGCQPYARDERPSKQSQPPSIPMRGMPEGDDPIEALIAAGGEAWAAFYGANMTVPPAMRSRLKQNDFQAVKARFQGLHEPRSGPGYLDPVQMPCLVYVGETEAAYGGAKQLTERLANGAFLAFPGFGHYDVLAEVDVVLPEIRRFLDSVAA